MIGSHFIVIFQISLTAPTVSICTKNVLARQIDLSKDKCYSCICIMIYFYIQISKQFDKI